MKSIILAVAFLCLVSSESRADNIVTNGSFETGVVQSGFRKVPAGDTFITGWTVQNVSVDVVTSPSWLVPDGRQAVDLAGSPGPGKITQALQTTPGRLYRARFALSSNDVGSGSKDVIFGWGSYQEVFRGGKQDTWIYFVRDLHSSTESTVISFESTSTRNAGGTVDDVSASLCLADYDENGFVNGDDFDAFVLAFASGDIIADYNKDEFVNGDDFDSFSLDFESGC